MKWKLPAHTHTRTHKKAFYSVRFVCSDIYFIYVHVTFVPHCFFPTIFHFRPERFLSNSFLEIVRLRVFVSWVDGILAVNSALKFDSCRFISSILWWFIFHVIFFLLFSSFRIMHCMCCKIQQHVAVVFCVCACVCIFTRSFCTYPFS